MVCENFFFLYNIKFYYKSTGSLILFWTKWITKRYYNESIQNPEENLLVLVLANGIVTLEVNDIKVFSEIGFELGAVFYNGWGYLIICQAMTQC